MTAGRSAPERTRCDVSASPWRYSLSPAPAATADEKLFGIACRSVHLGYPGDAGRAFTVEMTPTHSAPGTYFMAAGWRHGYFGIQELADGKKVVLFSVWDPNAGQDPAKVKKDDQVLLIHKDNAVRVGRFGNEGTGGQSFFDYDWKLNRKYRFLVTAKPNGTRTEFGGWFYVPETRRWKHLVTFSRPNTPEGTLSGYYSFIEDFKRDRASTKRQRQADFSNGWILAADGEAKPVTKARFTGDGNPATNIFAAAKGDHFTLATGGNVSVDAVKLRDAMELPGKAQAAPPRDLPRQAWTAK